MKYTCLQCGDDFYCDRCLDSRLIFCSKCREEYPDIIKNAQKIVRDEKRELQKQYWEEHPEEYSKFIQKRTEKARQTKIEKYGSLEEAERIKMVKSLETLKKNHPEEDWDNITNPSQMKVARQHIRDKAISKSADFYQERAEKIKQAKVEKYGSPEKAKEVIYGKVRATNVERYGVEYSLQLQSTRDALKEAIENDPQFYQKRKEKSDNTKIEKYGSLKKANEIMYQNCIKTVREKYNVNSVMQVEEIKQKAIDTYSRRAREEENFLSDIKKKTDQTKIKKYGSLEKAKEKAKEKRKNTFFERYGTTCVGDTPEIQKKVKATLFNKYGVINPGQMQDHWEKSRKTFLNKIEKFERENNCTHLSSLVKKYGQGWLNLELPRLYLNSFSFISNEYIPKIEEYFRMGNTSVSHSEKDILNFIKTIYDGEILENTRLVINPLELDIYIPEKKLAIEYNGNFWHSIDAKLKDYHENKSKLCEEKGIRLIHIYECDWKFSTEKIKSLLRIALGVGYSKIGARKCEVRKIDNKIAEEFNNHNHLQNHRKAEVTYGLFYNNELQQLMSFSQSKYNRNLKNDNEWEIIRGCPGSNNQIVGGVSKLFKAFVREYKPSAVFSYCDFNKFDGKGYEALGMEFVGYTGPDKFYIDKSGCRLNRNPKKRKELEESSLYTIYGAGSKKYIWRRNECQK